MPRPRVRAKPNTPDPLQQQADIFSMRNRGKSWEQIALATGMTPRAVSEQFYATLKANVVENISTYVNTELAHLYEITEALMPHVLGGSIDHVNAALRVVDARMKLLGANAALERQEAVTGPSAGHLGTVIELTAAGGEEDYVAALEGARNAVTTQSA